MRSQILIPEREPKLRKSIFDPIREFFQLELASGLLLIIITAIALLWANSSYATQYHQLWNAPLGLSFQGQDFTHTLLFWINEVLMSLFFLLVGLEIKREVSNGELADIRQAMLPLMGALGGMVLPAFIYAALNYDQPTSSGWGIPMATDIAFSLGILSLLGNRVPLSLKIFLAALAIADDLGAVLVIALFYSTQVQIIFLASALLITIILFLLKQRHIHSLPLYFLMGALLWISLYNAGVHPTLSGVILALMIPSDGRISLRQYLDISRESITELKSTDTESDSQETIEKQQNMIQIIRLNTLEVLNPLHRIESGLHPYISYLVIPLFALANAGVLINEQAISQIFSKESLGIMLGLFIGKPLGITLFCWMAVRTKIASLPSDINWSQLIAIAILGGIGFTMSVFISGLSFPSNPEFLSAAKLAVLIGSTLSALIGVLVIRWKLKVSKE